MAVRQRRPVHEVNKGDTFGIVAGREGGGDAPLTSMCGYVSGGYIIVTIFGGDVQRVSTYDDCCRAVVIRKSAPGRRFLAFYLAIAFLGGMRSVPTTSSRRDNAFFFLALDGAWRCATSTAKSRTVLCPSCATVEMLRVPLLGGCTHCF